MPALIIERCSYNDIVSVRIDEPVKIGHKVLNIECKPALQPSEPGMKYPEQVLDGIQDREGGSDGKPGEQMVCETILLQPVFSLALIAALVDNPPIVDPDLDLVVVSVVPLQTVDQFLEI